MTTTPTPTETLLVTVTGVDRPGVSSRLFADMAGSSVDVIDIEQIVLRGQLILGMLISAPHDVAKLTSRLTATAAELGMQIEITAGTGDNEHRAPGRLLVTVMGAPLSAEAVSALAGRIADCGANIDRIERLARYPVTAIQLHVSGAAHDRLRPLLSALAVELGIDVAVQEARLSRRGQHLIVMDVDSTLIQGEVIEMLAAHAGCADHVAEVTERAMQGELDFEASLRERVALLQGVPASALDEVYDQIQLTPGARTLVRTLSRLGYKFAIVSGGFSQITDRLAADLGIHFARANTLEIVDGVLTGQVLGPVIDRAGKATALREFAEIAGVPRELTVAIGDGANDLDMLNEAGLGIAWNARPVVQEQADTRVNVPYLDTIMYLLGISRAEIEAADAHAGFTTPAPPVTS